MQIRFGFHWVITNSEFLNLLKLREYLSRKSLLSDIILFEKININEYTPLLIFENYNWQKYESMQNAHMYECTWRYIHIPYKKLPNFRLDVFVHIANIRHRNQFRFAGTGGSDVSNG